MMTFTRIKLIPVSSVAKVATPDQVDLFKRRQHAIYGHEIAFSFLQAPVQFFRRKWPVLVGQDRENSMPCPGDPLTLFPQSLQCSR